jgi:hypothetical protein
MPYAFEGIAMGDLRQIVFVGIDTYLLRNEIFTISLEGFTVVIRFLVYAKARKRSDQL